MTPIKALWFAIGAVLGSRLFVGLLLFVIGLVHLAKRDHSTACIFVVLSSLMISLCRIERKIGGS